jgi:hypothetical protein
MVAIDLAENVPLGADLAARDGRSQLARGAATGD